MASRSSVSGKPEALLSPHEGDLPEQLADDRGGTSTVAARRGSISNQVQAVAQGRCVSCEFRGGLEAHCLSLFSCVPVPHHSHPIPYLADHSLGLGCLWTDDTATRPIPMGGGCEPDAAPLSALLPSE